MRNYSTTSDLRDNVIRGVVATAMLSAWPVGNADAAVIQEAGGPVIIGRSTSTDGFGEFNPDVATKRTLVDLGQAETNEDQIGPGGNFSGSVRNIDMQLSDLREMEQLGEDWDGLGAEAPKTDAIRNAIALLQVWPTDLPLPEVTLLDNGCPAFEFFEKDGTILGGIDFLGGDRCAYAFIKGTSLGPKGPASLLPKDVEEQLFRPARKFF